MNRQDVARLSAQHMVRGVWRKQVLDLVSKLSKEEGIGYTQAGAYIGEALESLCVAIQEPWHKATEKATEKP